MYKKIDPTKTFVDREKDILKLWQENNIVQKNFDLNSDGESFYFL